jgi:ubiquinone/menaquinone biosynthesis C-methylase UbiE
MADIIDDRGFNQVWERNDTFRIRIERRADLIINEMTKKDATINVLEIGSGTGEIAYFIVSAVCRWC